ncbi:MAG: transcription-repair coupling factor [Firmicutes bacterium]|nr:transcription-repair coupling factor [Bacillota bacterium]
MSLEGLLVRWTRDNNFRDLARQAEAGARISVTGLDAGSRVYLMAGLAHHLRWPALIITADGIRAEKIYEDCLSYFPGKEVHLLPGRELFITEELLAQSKENQQQRLYFLEKLRQKESGIFIAPVQAVLSKLLPPRQWYKLALTLVPGQKVRRDQLIGRLVELGYKRSPLIESRGQFSARGEILDVFPPGREYPLRIELFEDEVESIRLFNHLTQRSVEKLTEAAILPAHELIVTQEVFTRGEGLLVQELEQAVARLTAKGEGKTAAKLKEKTEEHLARLAEPGGLDLLYHYFYFFYGEGASLFDYLPRNFLVFIDDGDRVRKSSSELHQDLEGYRQNLFLQGELLPGQMAPLWKEEEIYPRHKGPLIACSLFPSMSHQRPTWEQIQIEAKGVPFYHGQWEMLAQEVRDWLNRGYQVNVLASGSHQVQALKEKFSELGLPAARAGGASDVGGQVLLREGGLQEGFILPSLGLVVINEQNLVPRQRKKRRLSRRSGEGVALRDYRELAVGDYVVHQQHGIGKYMGIHTLTVNDVQRDYLLIKYSGQDKLYIPVEQIDLIQKYIGEEGKAPRLHSLGGGEWNRIKNKVRSSVHELARELLSLYAARQAAEGYAYGPDHPWQAEFEVRFPYEETPDQLQAINDVKRDLEKKQPMDRLICGDVGYGKTEVALRAAFKVALEGKQVALLVPTTILAQQHFRTFRERFADFPLRVEQLSRFVPRAKQKSILEDLGRGRIDVIIGTHRLLSDDVRFHDLGLLIIDEEQRFGVRHKEKLKRMRLEVDVLAMTATPIPRTLHLSLVGVRDLSVIETPPENRYPVQTFVVEYSEQLIREAIQRELNRRGQVYFVFNRIEGIEAMARQLQKMFPQARLAVGHGRMSEAALERIMNDFLEGKYDILISTTIIEAGLDIPNVNTIIIYDADHFGLSQLYQLRGRVGRSNRLAYAYLTYRREKIVSETAQKRLQAIKEFTELGSGFKVALRDLEIRGAGNFLGAEQHGFMVAVGFDLYCRLLEEEVAKLQGRRREEVEEPPPQPRLDLQVSAYIPSSYVASQDQKIDFYQRIYALETEQEAEELLAELRDRYGPLPAEVENLLAVARLRILSQELGIENIQQQKTLIIIKFRSGININSAPLWKLMKDLRYKVALTRVEKKATLKLRVGEDGPLLERLEGFLRALRDSLREEAVSQPLLNNHERGS